MKPRSEMYRPNMYTMWDEAHKHSKNICGVYVPINTNLNQEFDITFENLHMECIINSIHLYFNKTIVIIKSII